VHDCADVCSAAAATLLTRFLELLRLLHRFPLLAVFPLGVTMTTRLIVASRKWIASLRLTNGCLVWRHYNLQAQEEAASSLNDRPADLVSQVGV
jgi:hypothetical protein